MTLHALFARHGITRPADLMHRVPDLTRQQAHLLYSGKMAPSRQMARRLADALGIPYADIMGAELSAPDTPTPRGRPRKRP